MTEWHTGQVRRVEPQLVHKHRCLHGSNNTLDSPTPQFLHILLPPPPPPPPLTASLPPSSSGGSVHRPKSLLPQLDSASSAVAATWRSSATWVRTCSRLLRSVLAVASLVCANSLQIWFSIHRLFTLSWRTQFSFPILWISSSFSFNLFVIASWNTDSNILDCRSSRSPISNLKFSACKHIDPNLTIST